MGVLNEYKAAHPAAPVPLARKMDGALLAIGTLADVLKVGWGGVGESFCGRGGERAFVGCVGREKGSMPSPLTPVIAMQCCSCLFAAARCPALQEKKPYNGQLEPMLLQHVVPLFESPHGHLR